MKTYKEFKSMLYETLLLEMPHIVLSDGSVADLEFETHSHLTAKEFLAYLKSWLEGKPIQAKRSKVIMQISSDVVKEFVKKLKKVAVFEPFVVNNYGKETWEKVSEMLEGV